MEGNKKTTMTNGRGNQTTQYIERPLVLFQSLLVSWYNIAYKFLLMPVRGGVMKKIIRARPKTSIMTVTYRDEFSADVNATNREDAIDKFARGIIIGNYHILSNYLHQDYYSVQNEHGFEVT